MELNNTPFSISETRVLDCQFGSHYYKEKPQKSSRVLVQGTRKKGCPAHIVIKKCIVYPDYKIDQHEQLKLRTLREKKMQALKKALFDKEPVTMQTIYFVSLPTEECHSGHPTGNGVAGFSQRVNEKVSAKISELVAEGITEIHEVRKLLRHYVLKDLCVEMHPDENDRAYFPIDNDIKNHIYMAKRALQLSCLDQENLRLKIDQWKQTDPDSTHYFRPYLIKKDCSDDTLPLGPQPAEKQSSSIGSDETTINGNQYEQTLLWVHQSDWQKELLIKYGNTISLIDATYKTTKYDLALFFICVKTNVGYSVVAEFVVQSETAESIAESLAILKQWNPTWNPRYFMTDYSEAESVALESVFPSTTIYLCDFHREQAWDRWIKDRKHGLTQHEGEELLALLRACAWAQPSSDGTLTSAYELAVDNLKKSSVWSNHIEVQQWLTQTWLSIPQVSMLIIVKPLNVPSPTPPPAMHLVKPSFRGSTI